MILKTYSSDLMRLDFSSQNTIYNQIHKRYYLFNRPLKAEKSFPKQKKPMI